MKKWFSVYKFPLVILTLVAMLFISGCSKASEDTSSESVSDGKLDKSITLRILEAGGPSGDYMEAGFVKPFTEKTGIEVVRESPTSLGKLQAMVESGQHTYDLVEVSSANLFQAKASGIIEKLNWDLINPDPLNEEGKHEYGMGYQYYSTIMAWNPDATSGKELTSWADFWDTEKFPGKRALPDYASFALPIALLADGVPKDKLYPLDIDRAFKSLEKIKKDVSIWWQSGSQPLQLLKDGEVDYSAAWSGRIVENEDNINYTFNEGLLDLSYLVVPKGAEHIDEISAFLHEMTIAENQANAVKVLPYTGPSKELTPLLPKDRLEAFPSSDVNYSKQSLTDSQWWAEHGKEVEEKWELFKLNLNK
jgi:putative spermidine/putrescine transport system substrate-binding protein